MTTQVEIPHEFKEKMAAAAENVERTAALSVYLPVLRAELEKYAAVHPEVPVPQTDEEMTAVLEAIDAIKYKMAREGTGRQAAVYQYADMAKRAATQDAAGEYTVDQFDMESIVKSAAAALVAGVEIDCALAAAQQ